MKRILALLLSAMLATLAVTSCTGGNTEDTTVSDTTDTEDTADTVHTPDTTDAADTADTTDTTVGEDTADTEDTSDTTEPDVTEPAVTDPPVTAPPVTDAPVTDAPVTAPPAPKYTAGKLTSKDYTSTWLDLSFTPTKNMDFSSAKDLADIDLGNTVCEMMATDKTTLSTAVISVFPSDYDDADDYFSGLIKTYEGTGVEVTVSDIQSKKLGGGTYSYALCDMKYMGDVMKTATYFRVIGDHSVTVIITYQTEAELNNFLSCFAAAK